MSDWTEGYVADVDYTFSYCYELNPVRAPLAFLSKGLLPPRIETACELGFGQGLGTNIHAAASAVEWWGTDFNPAQTGFARDLARAAGSNARLFEEAFEAFCRRDDLPDFDFIGMHGIWSWVSDRNREAIVAFVRRKLKPGGVLYAGYNAAPGWAGFVPMRDLMKRYSEIMLPQAFGALDRIDAAVVFAEKFITANPDFAAVNPTVVDRVEKIKTQDRHYLAHEYFNENWRPVEFTAMTEMMAPAKLGFAGSARYLDHIDGVNLTPEQVEFLSAIPDPVFRESARDVMVLRRFRCDYWVKGARRLTVLDHADRLRAQRFVLLKPRAEVSMKVQGAARETDMQEAVYGPVLDALADQTPRSVAEVEEAIRSSGLGLGQLVQALLVLAGSGQIAPTQDEAAIAAARQGSDRLNAHLTGLARDGSQIAYLASPVTGGGVPVARMPQLFLAAMGSGRSNPADWVDAVWPILAMQGQAIIRDGRPLETDEENRAELLRQAESFAEKQLPILKALQVC